MDYKLYYEHAMRELDRLAVPRSFLKTGKETRETLTLAGRLHYLKPMVYDYPDAN